MTRQQFALVAVHGAYVVVLILVGVWIALVLGENDPDDDWMISARMVFWPIAGMVALIAAGVAAATYWWVRNGNRGVLFVADMLLPILALIAGGPVIIDPSFMSDLPGIAFAIALALICGAFVAAVVPPAPRRARSGAEPLA